MGLIEDLRSSHVVGKPTVWLDRAAARPLGTVGLEVVQGRRDPEGRARARPNAALKSRSIVLCGSLRYPPVAHRAKEGSHRSNLNENYTPTQVSSGLKSTQFHQVAMFSIQRKPATQALETSVRPSRNAKRGRRLHRRLRARSVLCYRRDIRRRAPPAR